MERLQQQQQEFKLNLRDGTYPLGDHPQSLKMLCLGAAVNKVPALMRSAYDAAELDTKELELPSRATVMRDRPCAATLGTTHAACRLARDGLRGGFLGIALDHGSTKGRHKMPPTPGPLTRWWQVRSASPSKSRLPCSSTQASQSTSGTTLPACSTLAWARLKSTVRMGAS